MAAQYPPGPSQQASAESYQYTSPYEPRSSQKTPSASNHYQSPYQAIQPQNPSGTTQYQASYTPNRLSQKADADIYSPYGANQYQQPYQPGYIQQSSNTPYASQPTYQPASIQQASSVSSPYQNVYQQSPYSTLPQLSQQQPGYPVQSSSGYQQQPYDPYGAAATPAGYTVLPKESASRYPGPFPASSQPIGYQPGTNLQTPNPYLIPNRESSTLPITQQTTFGRDPLSTVLVHDGEDPLSFASNKELSNYIELFPEAENDQGCRVFRYGPKCSPNLLLPLFEHLDFPRFSLFPYGFANDFSTDRFVFPERSLVCSFSLELRQASCVSFALQYVNSSSNM